MFEIWADTDPNHEHSVPEIIDSWSENIIDDNPDGYSFLRCIR